MVSIVLIIISFEVLSSYRNNELLQYVKFQNINPNPAKCNRMHQL